MDHVRHENHLQMRVAIKTALTTDASVVIFTRIGGTLAARLAEKAIWKASM